MNDEQLNTLMCEIESIVRSKESDDPNDSEALTPNHLPVLHPGPSIPPGRFSKADNCNARRWRQVQYLADLFWRRWLCEYSPSLQQRQKWKEIRRNVKVNDIVLILDEEHLKVRGPLVEFWK